MERASLKILHTNFHRGWGGQSNRILAECKGLAARGHSVVLAVPAGSVLAERAAAAGIEVFTSVEFRRGFRPAAAAGDALQLRRLIRRRGFDLVHTHGSQDSWAAAYALLNFSPRPVMLRTRHNIFPMRDHWMNRLLYGRWTDGVVCISEAILEECAAKPYLRRENLELIHSAVDAARFDIGRGEDLRRELGVENRYVAGITGRLRGEKGHVHLLEALPEIIRSAPDFALLVVGSGSLEDDLRRRSRELGIESNVIFTGFRTDIPRVLSNLDLFIMPSISEGLGTAILEAAAAGLPIIATRVGGIPDIIRDGVGGLLVPPADPSALRDAALRFHADRDLATRCGKEAARRVRAEFSEERLVDRTIGVYQKFLARRRGNSSAA